MLLGIVEVVHHDCRLILQYVLFVVHEGVRVAQMLRVWVIRSVKALHLVSVLPANICVS